MAKKPVFPSATNLAQLVREIKKNVGSYGDDEDYITLTVGASGEGRASWSFQTGDNSYTGGAYLYPHWAVVEVGKRDNSNEVAKEILNQLHEAWRGAND